MRGIDDTLVECNTTTDGAGKQSFAGSSPFTTISNNRGEEQMDTSTPAVTSCGQVGNEPTFQEDFGNGNNGIRSSTSKEVNCQQQGYFPEHQNALQMIEAKNAQIQQMQQHLNILLDENNLLQLELQDVENTSTAKILRLEHEIENMEKMKVDLGNRLNNVRGIAQELSRLLVSPAHAAGDNNNNIDGIKMALEKLNEQVAFLWNPDQPNETTTNTTTNDINCSSSNNDSGITESQTAVSLQDSERSSSAATTGDVLAATNNASTISENLETDENDVTADSAAEINIQQTITIKLPPPDKKVPLRRSKRKVVVDSEVKLEPDVSDGIIPIIPTFSTSEKAPPPTKLQPMIEEETNNSISTITSTTIQNSTHAVDTSKQDGLYCVCGKRFKNQKKLDHHVQQMTCGWTFNCTMCGETQKTRKDLFLHQHEAHNSGPLSRYSKKKNPLVLSPPQTLAKEDSSIIRRRRRTRLEGSDGLARGKPTKNLDAEKEKLLNAPKTGRTSRRNKNQEVAPQQGINSESNMKKSVEPSPSSSSGIVLKPQSQSSSQRRRSSLAHLKHQIDTSKSGYFCACGNSFTSKTGLTVHVKYFTYEAKFQCSGCDRKFFSTCLLRSHMKSKHNIEFTGKDGCRRCGRCFPSRLKLYQHCKNVHKCGPLLVKNNKRVKVPSPDPEPPILEREDEPYAQPGGEGADNEHGVATSDDAIKCLCGKIFAREITLSEHLRLKVGKKVFKCESCPESFSRYDYFKLHLKHAHQQTCEGMGCRDCGARGFMTHVELREHRRAFHDTAKVKKPKKEQ